MAAARIDHFAHCPEPAHVPGEHAWPHAPQFVASVPCKFVQALPHIVWAELVHDVLQLPLAQAAVAPETVVEHAWPHVPQFAASVPCKFVQALPHIVSAGLVHAALQLPPTQVDAAPVTVVEHTVPQVPQLLLSVWKSTHLPLHEFG